jgi:hypothetical protein
MSESQAEAEPAAGHHQADAVALRWAGDVATGQRPHVRPARRGSGLRMLAVTPERLAVAESLAGAPGYLPTIPADSEDRSFD